MPPIDATRLMGKKGAPRYKTPGEFACRRLTRPHTIRDSGQETPGTETRPSLRTLWSGAWLIGEERS